MTPPTIIACQFGTSSCQRPASLRVTATTGQRAGTAPRPMCLNHAGIMLTVVAWDGETMTATPLDDPEQLAP